MFNQDYKDAFSACSAQALMENRSKTRIKKEQERREYIDDVVEANRKSTLPMVDELKALVKGLQEQNYILQNQVDEAKKESENAMKEARKSRTVSWISFGVATSISIVSLIISYIDIWTSKLK